MSRTARVSAVVLTLLVATMASRVFALRQTVGEKEELFAYFANLLEGEWVVSGKWSNGSAFEQVYRYERALDGRIIKALTLAPDSATGKLTPRAEGVRAWDATANQMRFWEFDRFGGITNGRVGLQDGVIYYEYGYTAGGRTRTLRDEWRARGKDEYSYRVGSWENGAWQQMYLESVMRRRPRS